MDRREEPKVGIASIDEHDHTLMQILSAFRVAVLAQNPKDGLRAVADIGLATMRAHFALEEELGERAGYPEAAEHHFQHQHLMLSATSLTHDTLSGSNPPEVQDENLELLRQIFLNHIAQDDQALADHLKVHGFGQI